MNYDHELVGKKVRVGKFREYDANFRDGTTGVVAEVDKYDASLPVRVIFDEDGDELWVHSISRVLDDELKAAEITEILVRNNASAQLAVELLSLLQSKNITVSWSN